MPSFAAGPLVGLTMLLSLVACQGGASDPDAGELTSGDATLGPSDASSPSPDGGGFLTDAGFVPDGGGLADAGFLTDGGFNPDGGPNDLTAVCQNACLMVDQCLGGGDPDCVSECAAEIGNTCSPSEIAQIDACSNGLCDSFESCLFAIPCIAGGGGNTCGDGVCDAQFGESCSSCPQDCGSCVCGDGTCSPGECSICATDCPGGCTCGDVCTTGPAQDPSCDPCQASVCATDSFCCETEWDGICVSEAESICGKDCPAFCGDTFCDPNEDLNSCPQDCGASPTPPSP